MIYKNLEKALNEKGLSVLQLSYLARIHSPDLYNALNGKKPFYPGWKKRVSEALEIPESELFITERDTNV